MLQDLEVLTPSLVVCAAFLIGIVMFLRRQMSPKRPGDEEGPADIPDDTRNAAPEDVSPPSSSRRIKH
jgi:membrane protein insertase Oxa1/YidC/SpoIIIJ